MAKKKRKTKKGPGQYVPDGNVWRRPTPDAKNHRFESSIVRSCSPGRACSREAPCMV